MAIVYPRPQPTEIGPESVTFRAVNAVSTTMSPFTYKQQTYEHVGKRWEIDVSLPSQRRDIIGPWVATLISLKGSVGTILMGDPNGATPRGTVSGSPEVSGIAGSETVTIANLTGTLLADDYIQLGSGANAKLHKVLVDCTANGDLEIWPSLKQDYSDEPISYSNTQGVFRMTGNMTEWSINNASNYGLSFSLVENLV